jgi:hypothetical protein
MNSLLDGIWGKEGGYNVNILEEVDAYYTGQFTQRVKDDTYFVCIVYLLR